MADSASPSGQSPRRGSTDSSGRRRSSAAERYANLTALKRDPSNPNVEARRASFADQNRKPGFLGQMWNNFTRGPNSLAGATGDASK
ncbi:hypothetical protein K490DRAFT_68991 [Saccharata proteae CBS 121410]|uniref:Conidiation-specific protein 8 n=1 Tax=Saccharata proteae CBS 121410 TaxID=1314787 RepID=A0A9P4HPB1_9PEZI|nr:hypothetical protein K490DRAFT_68991 [Saccharata proteae CBS 121410]